MLRVAHVIPFLGRAQGGPVVSLAAVAAAQVKLGCEVTVFATARPGDGERMQFDPAVRLVVDERPGWGPFRRCPELWRRCRESRFDILHSHLLWTDVHRMADCVACERRVPHVIACCGTLNPGALRHHWWKKVPARLWFQDRALQRARCIQAKSDQEQAEIRSHGVGGPVALVPNPVPGPAPGHDPAGRRFRETHRLTEQQRLVLFLGRLHKVKGIERLLDAWAKASREQPGWLLVLAGPDEGGYRAFLDDRVRALRLQDHVRFVGALDDGSKWDAYAAAEMFVMPSDFENFGMAIAEALLAGVPVITTTGTPWRGLVEAGAGWWVERTVEALAGALREGMACSAGRRSEMREKARAFGGRFGPDQAAADLLAVYEHLLGRTRRPDCIVVG